MTDKFERMTKFLMPFDKRHENPTKDFGISSMRIRFILKKKQQAVQIVISTNCYLQSVVKEYSCRPKFVF